MNILQVLLLITACFFFGCGTAVKVVSEDLPSPPLQKMAPTCAPVLQDNTHEALWEDRRALQEALTSCNQDKADLLLWHNKMQEHYKK